MKKADEHHFKQTELERVQIYRHDEVGECSGERSDGPSKHHTINMISKLCPDSPDPNDVIDFTACFGRCAWIMRAGIAGVAWTVLRGGSGCRRHEDVKLKLCSDWYVRSL